MHKEVNEVKDLIDNISGYIANQQINEACQEIAALLSPHYRKQEAHITALFAEIDKLDTHFLDENLEHAERLYYQIIEAKHFFSALSVDQQVGFYQQTAQTLMDNCSSPEAYESAIFYTTAALDILEKASKPLTLAVNQLKPLEVLLAYHHLTAYYVKAELNNEQAIQLFEQVLVLADNLADAGKAELAQALLATPWAKNWKNQHLPHFAGLIRDAKANLNTLYLHLETSFKTGQILQAYEHYDAARSYYQIAFDNLPHQVGNAKFNELTAHITKARAAYKHKLTSQPQTTPLISQHFRKKLQALRSLLSNLQREAAIQGIKSYSEGLLKLVEEIAAQIVTQLGEPPCTFTLIGLGSASRLELTPGSDLDVAILIQQPEMRQSDYFQTFISMLQSSLYLLGDKWEIQGNGKRSLGLHIDKSFLPCLTSCQLIQAPKQLADWVVNVLKKANGISQDFILAHSLQWACPIYCSDKTNPLLDVYNDALHERYEFNKPLEEIPSYCHIAGNCLRIHKAEFDKQLKDIASNKKVDLKKHLLAPLTYWCQNTALYYGLSLTALNETTLSAILAQLVQKEHLEVSLATAIKQALAKLLHARLQRHQDKKPDVLDSADASTHISSIFNPILLPLYYSLKPQAVISAVPLNAPIAEPAVTELLMPAVNPLSAALNQLIDTYRATAKSAQLEDKVTVSGLLQGLAYTFVEAQAEAASFQQHYEQLPEVLRPLFLNGVEQAFNQHPHLPEPYTQAVCDTLYRLPDTDGVRPLQAREQQQWRRALRSLVEKVNDANIKAIQAQGAIPLQVSSRNVEQPEQMQPERYVLKPKVAEQLVDAHQNFRPKPDGQPGRHTVLPIRHDGKLFWAKLLPEQPGTEYMVEQLAWRISIGGVPSSMLWKVHAKVPVAVQVTAGVPGLTTTDPKEVIKHTLEHALQKAPERLASISKKSFTQTLLRVLLTNPEDDKGDDYFLVPEENQNQHNHNHDATNPSCRLWRIDNERAYYAPDSVEQGWITSTNKLQVKSALYCLDHMRQPLDREAIKDFLKLDPYALLESWLEDLKVQHEHYRRLFNVGDIVYHLKLTAPDEKNQLKPMPSLLVLALGENLVKDLYNRLNSMQTVLRLAQKNSQPVTGLQLLEAVQPKLEAYYRAVFNLLPVQASQPERAYQRFVAVTKGLYHLSQSGYRQSNVQGLIAISQSLRLPPLNEELVKDIAKGEAHSPIQALAELQKLNETRTLLIRHQLLADDVKEIQAGIRAFKNLNINCQLVILRDILQSLDASQTYFTEEQLPNQTSEGALKTKPTVKQQQVILQAMAGIPFHQLTLASIPALTDSLLLPILQGAGKHLLAISIKDCPQVTEGFLESLEEHCCALQQLSLIGLKRFQRLEKINLIRSNEALEFAALTHLKLINLPELAVWQLKIPKLEALEIANCPRVTQGMVETLIATTLELVSLTLDNNPQLDIKPLRDMLLFERHQWTENLIEPYRQGNTVKFLTNTALTRAGLRKLISGIPLPLIQKLECFNPEPHVATVTGHSDTVLALAIMADGRIVSGSWDDTLRVWDADTQQCLATLKGHSASVRALAIMADGRIVSGSIDNTLRVWDVSTKKLNLSLLREKTVQLTLKEKQLVLNFAVENGLPLTDVEEGEQGQGERENAPLLEAINTYRELISVCFGLTPSHTSQEQPCLTYTCQDTKQAAEIQAFLQQVWQSRQSALPATSTSERTAAPSSNSPFWSPPGTKRGESTETKPLSLSSKE